MEIGIPSATEDDKSVCLWALLMAHGGQHREAMKLMNYAIKNSFGFSTLT